MRIFAVGQKCRRALDGAVVKVLETLPNGQEVFYRVEDCADGQERTVNGRDLRFIVGDKLANNGDT